jgi:MOSC domain-containing protein YiiM
MKLISVNTGLPREVIWHGINVTTGIFKHPVEDRVAVRKLNLDGDRQADLTVHGGEDKAVYCYPFSHYDYWTKELPVLYRFCRSDCHAASPALLQTWREVSGR